jgi:hypothetical protein
LYNGGLGIAYMFFHLSTNYGTEEEKKEYLTLAVKYLENYAKTITQSDALYFIKFIIFNIFFKVTVHGKSWILCYFSHNLQ